MYQFFTLELSFTIKPQFQLLFLLVICASPTPNSLLRPICICFSTSGTTSLFMHQRDAGEVISKEASRLFSPPYDTSPGSSESPLLDTQLWREQLQSLSLWSPHFLKSYFLFNLTLIPIELNLPLNWRWHSCQLSCFPLLCLILKASDCYFYPLCEKRKIVFEASLTHGPHGTAWVAVISLHLVPLASCASYMHFLTCAWSPTPSISLLQLKVGSLFKGDSPGREGEL